MCHIDVKFSILFESNGRYAYACIVCKLETGKRVTSNTVYCEVHHVVLCNATPRHAVLSCIESILAPKELSTCWEKYHYFYYNTGIFNTPDPDTLARGEKPQTRVKRSHWIWKERNRLLKENNYVVQQDGTFKQV